MQTRFLLLFLFSSPIISAVGTVYRVRKFIERPEFRRSAADDDLDMAAAELVFKENQSLKSLSSSDGIEAPPRKLPFGTEHARNEPAGAPSAEPTLSELKKTHLEDVEREEELKSSMVAPVGAGAEKSEIEEEGLLSTEPPSPIRTTPEGLHDGDTLSGRVPTWQKPLETHGRLIAYDFNVNPEYPQFAPRARGLVGIPDGWNLDKTVDEEFKTGFRRVDFRRRHFN